MLPRPWSTTVHVFGKKTYLKDKSFTSVLQLTGFDKSNQRLVITARDVRWTHHVQELVELLVFGKVNSVVERDIDKRISVKRVVNAAHQVLCVANHGVQLALEPVERSF